MNCPICNRSGKIHLFQVKDIHYRIDGTFDIYRCKGCGLDYLSRQVFEEFEKRSSVETSIYETEEYYAYDDPGQSSRMTRLKLMWIQNNRNSQTKNIQAGAVEGFIYFLLLPYLNDFMWWVPELHKEKCTFLDVGCGSGKMVHLMQSLGFEAWGTDISDYGSRMGNESNLKILSGDFREVDLPENYFDYVHSAHAIEHMSEPVRVFKKLWKIIKPGGVGYICVPNGASLSYKIFRDYWYFLGAPVHPLNYTSRAIKSLLLSQGFEVLKVRSPGDFQGVLGSLQAYFNRNTDQTSHEGLIWNSLPLKGICQLLGYGASMVDMGSHLQIQFKKPLK
jgi:2-polyprenyl-3-methyl-5-hydroxy-6-metoxy-1,4-benzoquinol methylase